MKKTILSVGALLLYSIMFAQTPKSILTVFSEDGHKFYLILNGQRQNDKPETNIRVENLNQEYYNCKIIFEDKALGELSKTFLQVVDVSSKTPQDVTYKIKAKDGKQVLRYFSATPIDVSAPPVRPQGVSVYNFGVPTPVVSETTTTVVQTTNAQSATNVSMNAMGVNVNVTMPTDPIAVSTTTTTTTTTTSSSSSSTAPPPVEQPVPTRASSACAGYPMAPGDFDAAKSSVTDASFEETKLSTAKQIISGNCLYASQIAEMCRLFGFENTKLDFAKAAYRRCIDPQNYFKVNSVFDFDASKTELSKYTSGR